MCVREMRDAGIPPDAVTYINVFKACGMVGSLDIGEDIEAEAQKKGLLKNDAVMSNALLNMYSKCGSLEKAREVFEQLPVHDVVSWNVLISGYVQCGLGDEALQCFRQMQDEVIEPTKVAFSCTLIACGTFKDIERGLLVHHGLVESGVEVDMDLGITLVQMYLKCESLEEAWTGSNHPTRKQIVERRQMNSFHMLQ